MITEPEVTTRARVQVVDQPAEPLAEHMPETSSEATYLSLIAERNQIRETMSAPPSADRHVSIAVFEAWADGSISESDVLERVNLIHGKFVTCDTCRENIDYYRARRTDLLS